MKDLESYAKDLIASVIPHFEALELRATVSDSSYSVEFFVTVNGERKQCYELVDEGMVEEDQLDRVVAQITAHIRQSEDYQIGQINKVSFQINC